MAKSKTEMVSCWNRATNS